MRLTDENEEFLSDRSEFRNDSEFEDYIELAESDDDKNFLKSKASFSGEGQASLCDKSLVSNCDDLRTRRAF